LGDGGEFCDTVRLRVLASSVVMALSEPFVRHYGGHRHWEPLSAEERAARVAHARRVDELLRRIFCGERQARVGGAVDGLRSEVGLDREKRAAAGRVSCSGSAGRARRLGGTLTVMECTNGRQ
jgi:hypothetical protein